jgi:N-acetylglutamate synthase-like GNAT family acetyltransferase
MKESQKVEELLKKFMTIVKTDFKHFNQHFTSFLILSEKGFVVACSTNVFISWKSPS